MPSGMPKHTTADGRPIDIIQSREQLRDFAAAHGLPEDWHEPEQGEVDALLARGFQFDNSSLDARGFRLYEDPFSGQVKAMPVRETAQEHGVFLLVEGVPVAFVNLAVLLALAAGTERVG